MKSLLHFSIFYTLVFLFSIQTSLFAQESCFTEGKLFYEFYYGKFDGSVDNIPFGTTNDVTFIQSGYVDHFDVQSLQRSVSPKGPNSKYGIRYTGFLDIPTSGKYKFFVESDDGVKLFIDNELVLDNDGNQPVGGGKEHSDNLKLSSGLHKITYLYYDAGSSQINSFQITGPGLSKQNIPSSMMLTSGAGARQIFNGDFQLNMFNRAWTVNPDGRAGWTTELNYPFHRAYLLSNSGTSDALLSQDISVEIGTENILSFDLGAITSFANNSTIEVLIDDQVLFTKTATEISTANGGDTSLLDASNKII